MIAQNRQLTNDIYLRSVAVDAEIDSTDLQALLVIALLTPYIGGDGVCMPPEPCWELTQIIMASHTETEQITHPRHLKKKLPKS